MRTPPIASLARLVSVVSALAALGIQLTPKGSGLNPYFGLIPLTLIPYGLFFAASLVPLTGVRVWLVSLLAIFCCALGIAVDVPRHFVFGYGRTATGYLAVAIGQTLVAFPLYIVALVVLQPHEPPPPRAEGSTRSA